MKRPEFEGNHLDLSDVIKFAQSLEKYIKHVEANNKALSENSESQQQTTNALLKRLHKLRDTDYVIKARAKYPRSGVSTDSYKRFLLAKAYDIIQEDLK